MKYHFICFCFLFILLSNLVIAQDVIVIKNEKQIINIAKQVSVLEDKENTLSIKDMLRGELKSKFTFNTTENISLSNIVSSTWAKFSLQNISGKELFLQIEDFDIPNFEIYIPTGIPDSFRVKKFGSNLPFFSKEIITNFYLVSLVEAQDSAVNTFYIRFYHKSARNIPLRISEAKSFFEENHERDIFYGIFIGVMSIMALYNFFIYLIVKDITYLYYFCHIVTTSLSILVFSGYGFNLFWYNYPQVNELIIPFIVGPQLIFLIIFSISFLNTAKYAPLAQKGLYVFIAFFIVNTIYSIFNQTTGLSTSKFIVLILCLYLFSLALYIYIKGNKAARFYLLANSFYLLGVVIILLTGMRILPRNLLTINFYQVGSMLEVLFFSFALADRIRTLTKEREETQKANIKLIEEQKEMLEAKVKERTAEVEKINAEMLAQNEELHQQQEELLAVNEALESKNTLIETQRAEIDKQVAEFQRANDKLKSNEEVLKKSFYKLKESENKVKEQNAKMLAQRVEIDEQMQNLQRINSKVKANEEILKKSLMKLKESETKIKEQNANMLAQNEELQQQQEELMTVNEALERTFTELKTTSDRLNKSIGYAYNIQQIILPKKDKLDDFFSEHFSIYLPKDVVSGDFYWFARLSEEKAIFLLADCTGHGVPGAFMSMIGNTLLHEIIQTKGIISPEEILNYLHLGIRNVLRQEESKNSDGMDISICLFEKNLSQKECQVTFSGAKSSIFYVKDSQITQLNGDRISLGGFTERKRVFTNQIFKLKDGEVVYFTSDGYIDQHNVERRRFSSAKFRELLSNISDLPIQEQEKAMILALKEHQQKEEQRDDISVVSIKI